MVVIGVIDKSFFGVGRYGDQWDARAVPRKVHGLDITAVIVAAAFVIGDQDRCLVPQISLIVDHVDEIGDKVLVKREDGVRRMPGQLPQWATKATEGTVPAAMSAQRLLTSCRLALRGVVMMLVNPVSGS